MTELVFPELSPAEVANLTQACDIFLGPIWDYFGNNVTYKDVVKSTQNRYSELKHAFEQNGNNPVNLLTIIEDSKFVLDSWILAGAERFDKILGFDKRAFSPKKPTLQHKDIEAAIDHKDFATLAERFTEFQKPFPHELLGSMPALVEGVRNGYINAVIGVDHWISEGFKHMLNIHSDVLTGFNLIEGLNHLLHSYTEGDLQWQNNLMILPQSASFPFGHMIESEGKLPPHPCINLIWNGISDQHKPKINEIEFLFDEIGIAKIRDRNNFDDWKHLGVPDKEENHL